MSVLNGLKPEKMFMYFQQISDIPRESGDMERIADYCVKFAKDRNLEHYRDDMHNVIIVKEATKGYENSEAIILQGHLDMVCEKVSGSNHDFTKDKLKLVLEGDKLSADGTTLGGDNGIAIAMILALLDSDDVDHPRIEAVFTVDEETGLYGAEAIDVSMLKAKKFINLDSEDEGVVTVSCAGGVTTNVEVPLNRENVKGQKFKLVVSGLVGGHSGVEINRGRANANILMGRILYSLLKSYKFNIFSLAGGSKDNVITKESVAELIFENGDFDGISKLLQEIANDIKNEFSTVEKTMSINIEKLEDGEFFALDLKSTKNVADILLNIPNGITAMSRDIDGLVETSLNLGVVLLKDDKLILVSGLRSSIESAKWALADRVTSFMELFGANVEKIGNYPGWAYKKDSALRQTVIEVYKEQYGEEPTIEAIHAGLECGMFTEKIDDLDCVSIGPDLRDVHTPDEYMSISSAQRTWKLLLGILKASK
ncbi:MAG: aminoacyl-histidine dipeptidase [Eubacteriales bacterium]